MMKYSLSMREIPRAKLCLCKAGRMAKGLMLIGRRVTEMRLRYPGSYIVMFAIQFVFTNINTKELCKYRTNTSYLPSLSNDRQTSPQYELVIWVKYGTVLNCTVVLITAMHPTALHCTVLQSNVLQSNVLHYTAWQCTFNSMQWFR